MVTELVSYIDYTKVQCVRMGMLPDVEQEFSHGGEERFGKQHSFSSFPRHTSTAVLSNARYHLGSSNFPGRGETLLQLPDMPSNITFRHFMFNLSKHMI